VTAEHIIFYGPPLIAVLLAALAIIVWRRNLGPTPLVWVLFGIAALILLLLGGFILALGLAGV